MHNHNPLFSKILREYEEALDDEVLRKKLLQIDVLVRAEEIKIIKQGVESFFSISEVFLCRYLYLCDNFLAIRPEFNSMNVVAFSQVLLQKIGNSSYWKELAQNGAFDRIRFFSLGLTPIEELSPTEKVFCLDIAKEMIRLPAGDFEIGNPNYGPELEGEEAPFLKIRRTRDILVGKYLVTQLFWDSVMGSNPSWHEGANRPVEHVRFFDAMLFCNVLSEREGLEPAYTGNYVHASDLEPGVDIFEDLFQSWEDIKEISDDMHFNKNANGYRLLTDAEWDHAAQGGKEHLYSGSNNAEEVAWTSYAGDAHKPVGMKKPNGFGFYDMSGNVDEWCWDAWYEPFCLEDGEKETFRIDPVHETEDFDYRMTRGGYRPHEILLSNRYCCEAWKGFSSIGFRIARNCT